MDAVGSFARSRWGVRFTTRRGLERHRRRAIRRLLRERMPRATASAHGYAALADVPVVDKAAVLADFAGWNALGIDLEAALAAARTAERTRDFSGLLPGGITVGLSSGTSGRPGVFLVDASERMRWAGTVLGRLLDRRSLRQLLVPWRAPVRIAFCLRANSTLYESVASRRLDFRFVDLVAAFADVLAAVAAARPDVLVAPASVLGDLARAQRRGGLAIAPRTVVAVAEVFDPADAEAAERAWGVRPRRVYQATEGLLALDCAHGRLHLNERGVVVEPEWLDTEHRRFTPIVTDLERRTQLVVRYRLDDVLRLPAGADWDAPATCPCGDPSRVIEAVEGRADEVVEALGPDGGTVRVFPDTIRRAMALAVADGDSGGREDGAEWAIRWTPGRLEVALERTGDARADAALDTAVRRALAGLFATVGARPPDVRITAWAPPPPGDKLVRIRRAAGASTSPAEATPEAAAVAEGAVHAG
ncbi:F390 synthetase-related protein [Agromyces aurantiacus]|uniref:F390 synthetase-related protein n=1 Tax=Agromyces aurantiacus TaxID=165814 RepID=A0ABV9QZK7_9MICO|nr:F390 synthetase-related protein [Agromyces aurantiacus]MBM7505634.1 putative adenylate-forming enzyme [Agromyces aurantiacus]